MNLAIFHHGKLIIKNATLNRKGQNAIDWTLRIPKLVLALKFKVESIPEAVTFMVPDMSEIAASTILPTLVIGRFFYLPQKWPETSTGTI